MNEGRMYSHLLVGIFCRVQRKFIHFHLNLQLCETVVEWVLTCRGFCPEIATGCAKAEGGESCRGDFGGFSPGFVYAYFLYLPLAASATTSLFSF